MEKKHIACIVLIAIAVAALGGMLLTRTAPQQPPQVVSGTPQQPRDVVSYETTLRGTYVACVPHSETAGAKKCNIGIKTENGTFYALDFNLYTKQHPTFNKGDYIVARGLLTPVEMISSDQTRGRVGSGIFSLREIIEAKSGAQAE